MSGAIAIFAKTPGLTPAKTRLAAGIGEQAAEAFYLLALDAVETTVGGFLQRHPDWIARWAVAEAAGAEAPRWQRFGARHTGSGELGERMWRVYEGLRRVHGRVLLIGADCPQMVPGHLVAAARALERGDIVFGPASDGGFWLFGGRRMIAKPAWIAPRWSGPHAMADFVAELCGTGLPEPACLATLTDIDEAADLARLPVEMPRRPSAAQRRLTGWLRRTEPYSA